MPFILIWIVNTFALIIVTYVVPGISINNLYSAFITALFLGLFNAIIRPILIILTLPINILTLGLFTLVINALMFLLVSSFIKGFDILGFWPAFWGALIYSLVTWAINMLMSNSEKPANHRID